MKNKKVQCPLCKKIGGCNCYKNPNYAKDLQTISHLEQLEREDNNVQLPVNFSAKIYFAYAILFLPVLYHFNMLVNLYRATIKSIEGKLIITIREPKR